MLSPTVYLAGTITKEKAHLAWREAAIQYLGHRGIKSLSPCRGKDPESFSPDGLGSSIDPKLFVARDLLDVEKADAVLVVFWKGLPRQSLGTWFEMGYAHAKGKPIFIVTDDPSVAFHPFVVKLCASVHDTVQKAADEIAWMLGDYS